MVGCWDGVVILVQCDSLALIVSRVGNLKIAGSWDVG